MRSLRHTWNEVDEHRPVVNIKQLNRSLNLVHRQARSSGGEGVSVDGVLHGRAPRKVIEYPLYAVKSNPGGGAYTVQRQIWTHATTSFGDDANYAVINAWDANDEADWTVGTIVFVHPVIDAAGEIRHILMPISLDALEQVIIGDGVWTTAARVSGDIKVSHIGPDDTYVTTCPGPTLRIDQRGHIYEYSNDEGETWLSPKP